MDPKATRGSVVIGDAKRRAFSEQEEQAVLGIIKSFMSALGKFQQYPTINEIVLDAMNDSFNQLGKWLRTHANFECVSMQGNLQVNNAILSMPGQQKDFVQAFLFYLTERNVRTLEIRRDLQSGEMQRFYEFFAKPAKEIVAKKNLSRALKRMGLRHVNLSRELVMDNVIVRTEMSGELYSKLSKLNIDELLEKANIISKLDINTLHKVGDLATMVTNLAYTKHEDQSSKILGQLLQTFHSDNAQTRLNSAKTLSQITEKAVDYTLYGLHSEVGSLMADQLSKEDDPQVFGALAKGLEKAAQIHIAKGDYDEAMKIVMSIDRGKTVSPAPDIRSRADVALTNIASPAVVRRLINNLEGGDEKAKATSMELLGQVGKKAVPDLIDLLYTTNDNWVLQSVVEILMQIGKPAQQELYAELNEDMDDRFREAMLRVCGEIGDVHTVIKVVPFLLHANHAVAGAAFRALLKIGGPAAEVKVREHLESLKMSPEFFRERVNEMGQFKNAFLAEPLAEFLIGKGPFAQYAGNEEIEIDAVRALGQIGGADAVAGLSEMLTAKRGFLGLGKGKEKVEVAAATALGRLGDPAAKPALEKAAKSKFKTVVFAAEKALRNIEKPQMDETIMAAPTTAAKQDEPTVYAAAPDAATMIKDEPAEAATVMNVPAIDEATILSEEEIQTVFTAAESHNARRLVLTVGPMKIDNVKVTIPGVDEVGKTTADQRGAMFELAPGEYQVIIKDQGMEVKKSISVAAETDEVTIDLQDIFNF